MHQLCFKTFSPFFCLDQQNLTYFTLEKRPPLYSKGMNKQIHFKDSTGSRIALNTALQLPFFLPQKHKVSAHFKPKGKK